MTPPTPPKEITQLMRFVAEKTKNVEFPMNMLELCRQFKEESGSLMVLSALRARIEYHRQTIHKMEEFDMNTKVTMMFALSASLEKGFLNELKKQADVEVDEKGRITKYQSKDGSLKLEGIHGLSSIRRSLFSNRWQKVCQKANDDVSKVENDKDTNGQRDYEKKRISLVKFLIERTKNATSPLNINQLARDYKKESKSSEPFKSIESRIRRFRQRIREMIQFDKPTKVKMLFALSVPIDEKLLKELQNDAIVELDENQRIKKYEANDRSLGLGGDHSCSAKAKAGWADKKKRRVVNYSSESEDDGDEEDSSESVGSEEEEDGKNVGESTNSTQASTSSSARRSDRLQKSRTSLQNKNKKMQLPEKNFHSNHTRSHARMSRGKKRARISYSSSETSVDESLDEDDEESEKSEDDVAMDDGDNNVENGGDDFEYDPPINNYHNVTDPNSKRGNENPKVMNDDKKETGPSSSVPIESMSLLEFLNHLRPTTLQYTPTLVPRIDENIKKLESEDQQIPYHFIIESLESCIQILNTPDEMDPDENTTSLCDFFYRLERAMHNITHPMMDDLRLKIENLAWAEDTKVSFGHIRYAMGKTIDKILH